MADFFVKTDGNDGNNGTTWALAKATIQAGLNLATGTGDRVIIAPGRYRNGGVAPAAAGSAANPKYLIGDYSESIADGGANTHGKGAGWVTVDMCNGTTGAVPGAVAITNSNNWAGWDISGMLLIGGADFSGVSGTSIDYFRATDCVFVLGVGASPVVNMQGWQPADTEGCITFERCAMIDVNGAQAIWFGSNTGLAAPTNHPWKFVNCYIECRYSNAVYMVGSVNQHVLFVDTTVVAHGAPTYAIRGTHATTCLIDLCRVYVRASNAVSNATHTVVDGALHEGGTHMNANWTQGTKYGLILPIPRLFSDASVIDALASQSAPTTSVDIFGRSRPQNTNYDIGALEYESNFTLVQPVGAIKTQSAPGGSGGCSIIGGAIVRRA